MRPVGRTVKLSKIMLAVAYRDEHSILWQQLWWIFLYSACQLHAPSTIETSVALCCATKLHIWKWPFIVPSTSYIAIAHQLKQDCKRKALWTVLYQIEGETWVMLTSSFSSPLSFCCFFCPMEHARPSPSDLDETNQRPKPQLIRGRKMLLNELGK